MNRILVVDGEPQLVRALRINLLARQYDVVVAAGGAEALRLAADCRPDLVVLDLGRPDLDGVDVIRQLRAWARCRSWSCRAAPTSATRSRPSTPAPTYLKQTHYLRRYVNQRRHKLEPGPARPRHLLTEPRRGYNLQL